MMSEFYKGFEKKASDESSPRNMATGVGLAAGTTVAGTGMIRRHLAELRENTSTKVTNKELMKNLKPGDIIFQNSRGKLGINNVLKNSVLKNIAPSDIKPAASAFTGSPYMHSVIVSKDKRGAIKALHAGGEGTKIKEVPLKDVLSGTSNSVVYRHVDPSKATKAVTKAKELKGTPYSEVKSTAKYMASALTGVELPGGGCTLGAKGQALCHHVIGHAYKDDLGKTAITPFDVQKNKNFKPVMVRGLKRATTQQRILGKYINPLIKGGLVGGLAAGTAYAGKSLYDKIKGNSEGSST